MNRLFFMTAACLVLCLSVPAWAQGSLIPFRDPGDGPAATATSQYSSGFQPVNATDGTTTMWTATEWMSAGNTHDGGPTDSHPAITFYFDGLYLLDHVVVTNYYGEDGGRGARNINILVSTNGIDFTSIFDQANPYTTLARSMNQDWSPGQNGKWVQAPPTIFDFDEGVWAVAVRFEILSNYFGVQFGDDCHTETTNGRSATITGLTNAAFYGTKIPEPATMTLLALGGLALLRRRR